MKEPKLIPVSEYMTLPLYLFFIAVILIIIIVLVGVRRKKRLWKHLEIKSNHEKGSSYYREANSSLELFSYETKDDIVYSYKNNEKS